MPWQTGSGGNGGGEVTYGVGKSPDHLQKHDQAAKAPFNSLKYNLLNPLKKEAVIKKVCQQMPADSRASSKPDKPLSAAFLIVQGA